jgi:hypothetical protein
MSYYTSAERKSMRDAISAHDRCVAIKRAGERLARLAVIAIAIFIPVFMFYVASGVG